VQASRGADWNASPKPPKALVFELQYHSETAWHSVLQGKVIKIGRSESCNLVIGIGST
jgi:hypothetical protein